VTSASKSDAREQDAPCALCDCMAGRRPCHVIAETRTTVAFLNPRQRSQGSVLVVPRRHISPMSALTEEETFEGFVVAREIGVALFRAFRPDGLHTWCRLSRETPKHFVHHHFQLVPRYNGEPYSYAKSWELDLTDDSVLQRIAQTLRNTLHVTAPTCGPRKGVSTS